MKSFHIKSRALLEWTVKQRQQGVEWLLYMSLQTKLYDKGVP